VGSSFGLKGFVKVKPFSGESDHFTRLKKATLRLDGKEKDWEIAEVIPKEGTLVMRFHGIDTPEAAAALKGAEIVVEREYAAPLQEGEYYVEDLKGLQVMDRNGVKLGHIVNIIEGGGGNLVEIKLHTNEIRLIPFRNEFFGPLDFSTNSVELLETWILE
jgi:16S rRNA processing protein RimM